LKIEKNSPTLETAAAYLTRGSRLFLNLGLFLWILAEKILGS
jgi:hypothetical protein